MWSWNVEVCPCHVIFIGTYGNAYSQAPWHGYGSLFTLWEQWDTVFPQPKQSPKCGARWVVETSEKSAVSAIKAFKEETTSTMDSPLMAFVKQQRQHLVTYTLAKSSKKTNEHISSAHKCIYYLPLISFIPRDSTALSTASIVTCYPDNITWLLTAVQFHCTTVCLSQAVLLHVHVTWPFLLL